MSIIHRPGRATLTKLVPHRPHPRQPQVEEAPEVINVPPSKKQLSEELDDDEEEDELIGGGESNVDAPDLISEEDDGDGQQEYSDSPDVYSTSFQTRLPRLLAPPRQYGVAGGNLVALSQHPLFVGGNGGAAIGGREEPGVWTYNRGRVYFLLCCHDNCDKAPTTKQ